MLQEYVLEIDPAAAYIASQLELGWTFAAHLLSLPLSAGQVATSLPPGQDPSGLLEFSTGGKAWLRDMRPLREALVVAYLAKAEPECRCAVFETLFSPDAPVLTSRRIEYFAHGSEAYTFLTAPVPDEIQVRDTIGLAGDYPFIGALLSTHGEELKRLNRGSVTDAYLETLSHSVDYLLIGAYDDESFLIWGRDLEIMDSPTQVPGR